MPADEQITAQEHNQPTVAQQQSAKQARSRQSDVADAWSDEGTGEYVFTDLDLTRKYTVFAYDHTLAYRAVIADNLSPEPMP